MPAPFVVDALRDQLLQVLDWYHEQRPGFQWGIAIHRRNERGRIRFGAVTPNGESLALSAPLVQELGKVPCWLDGAVPVRLETRSVGAVDAWVEPAGRGRAPLVESMII